MRNGITGYALVALLGACAPADTARTDVVVRQDTLPGGIPRIISHAATEWQDTAGWHLVLDRTIEGDTLGDLRAAHLLADGGLLLHEQHPARVRLLPPGGGAERILAREGDGPGEIRHVQIAVVGDTVVLYDTTLGRITWLLAGSGRLMGSVLLGSSLSGVSIAVDGRGRVWIPAMRPGSPAGQWLRADRGAGLIDSIAIPALVTEKVWRAETANSVVSEAIPFQPTTASRIRRDGLLITGRTDRDEFLVSTDGRDTVRIIARTGAVPWPVTEEDKDNHLGGPGEPALDAVRKRGDIPSVRPLWDALFLDEDENLWVRRVSPRFRDRVRFDVYAPDGRYRGAVAAPFGADGMSWAGSRVAVTDESEAGVPRVRIYRIVK